MNKIRSARRAASRITAWGTILAVALTAFGAANDSTLGSSLHVSEPAFTVVDAWASSATIRIAASAAQEKTEKYELKVYGPGGTYFDGDVEPGDHFLSGLPAESTFSVWLTVWNGSKFTRSQQSFTTEMAVASRRTEDAVFYISDVEAESATVNIVAGTPRAIDSYGIALYEGDGGPVVFPAGIGENFLSDLKPDTVYHVRVIARGPLGPVSKGKLLTTASQPRQDR
ncbi:hypothetical protein ACWPKO_28040 (plasmid) [Coraliomargarita sp. W4R53]